MYRGIHRYTQGYTGIHRYTPGIHHANQLSLLENSQDVSVETPIGLEPNDGPVPTAGEPIAKQSSPC